MFNLFDDPKILKNNKKPEKLFILNARKHSKGCLTLKIFI